RQMPIVVLEARAFPNLLMTVSLRLSMHGMYIPLIAIAFDRFLTSTTATPNASKVDATLCTAGTCSKISQYFDRMHNFVLTQPLRPSEIESYS
ncbi:4334_t:CDS:1, partial [Acaulospora colombiana]